MDKLKKRILTESGVSDGDIIHVDMFLNHCLDTELIEEIGKALAKRFKSQRATKVLTAESSGIPTAVFVAHALGIPALYAKKYQVGYIDPDVYSTEIHSFSMEKSFTLRVSKRYLEEEDRVLIIDDILSSGQATLGLVDLVSQSGAEIAGVGVAIEKGNKEGGQLLRQMGIRVESLVVVDRITDGQITFSEN